MCARPGDIEILHYINYPARWRVFLKLINALVKVTAGLNSGKTLSALAEAYL